MKKCLALLLLLLICATPALADQNRVIDESDVLSFSDESRLEQAISLIRQQYKFDVVLLTTPTIDGREARYYAGDYYDYNGFGCNDTHDGIILLLVTGAEEGNREYAIVMTGRGEKIFTDAVLYSIEDDILPHLRISNYSVAVRRFVEDVEFQLSLEALASAPSKSEIHQANNGIAFVIATIVYYIVSHILNGGIQ